MKALTRRQREVLALAANGNTNQQIARWLHISRDTVNNILGNAYRTLGAHDRAHAVAIALAVGELGVQQIIVPDQQRGAAA
ncbi:helix-turn-helix transcriptional regulator [Streptomyces sp. NBC_01373]|uniref:helix-turn-helix domain-containing protein n=1 Tax=Streptomyces sp. NBC_01373 TaxID=2903843 RepID=UPI00224F4F57|nr:helix-turn-helix transcriptional regulator [Streptomyces sp. NBC_01373]MCX4697027.1 helix-turn-helix transcriptional regulator [Streptomyces sp. NBC_01373]MCX4707048.1 helix-turn-helix transcriptional regulator [Streptomyces sp. NBC_01373]